MPRVVMDLDGVAPPPLPRCPTCDAPRLCVGWRTQPAAFVLLAPAAFVAGWRALERITERAFWRTLSSAPTPVQREADQCLRRVVFGAAPIAEKLLAWDAGLDDAVIECLKLDLRMRSPTLRALPGADLRLIGIDATHLRFAATEGPGLRAPRLRLSQLMAERSTLAHRWPALFSGPFVDHLRLRA